ncbi:deubiquitinase OTU2 NDAI_0B01670 [Naumovozyma dairenensis CBS 421]|uniref:OTU domain-containing protein n=1 Tax=Naumovozyma dairenensis (strain ATCC 10597 / BCRC 20456 / CBS 421 / NBRC 0211 / NRRL Y-12639) TaxID=1071378 RepID=G0W5Z0_NAUDC|nr:hypothetical protein NDAI_0B01670 [Naumovozyma dairenensis CBS 421]CCD23201.1 hypothetical protein NDAI_0B01670 [Naumovozyma dairenensis CBS 421]
MEELLSRHRKEKKDLQNQITGMKKQATKSQRKQVNSKCIELQESLELKHSNEIKEWKSQNNMIDEIDKVEFEEDEITPEKLLEQLKLSAGEEEKTKKDDTATPALNQQPKKRRNRQKEKLAKRDAEIARMKEEARLEASKQPDLKKIEQDSLNHLYQLNKVKEFDIQPDGHCLFASILDQLQIRHKKNITEKDNPKYKDLDVYKLRKLACDYIRENKNDFIPYLFDESTMSLKDIDEYTKEMETTAKWGGEIEILALSKVFDCPISILMSGRATHKVNEQGTNPELKLVYYKHTYALGEHYNSLHDL